MADFENYLVASQRYFEPMSRYRPTSEYRDLLSSLLPGDWKLARENVWFVASTPHLHCPDQGFKIHVSSTVVGAKELLEIVVPACVRSQAIFKLAADPFILGNLTNRRCPRQSSGKFITVYPRGREHFLALIEDIHQATKGFAGPYILSDRRYKDSKVVFYRYGGFIARRRLLAGGRTHHIMTTPAGAEIEDKRTPFFSLPEGITDPFPADRGKTKSTALPMLQNRFQITGALAFSNSGGVYSAHDAESRERVVVKEARPYTLLWSTELGSVDAVSLLRREYEILNSLRDLSSFPRPIALFQEWEHWFLVQEFIGGQPLSRYRARDDVALVAHIYEPDRVAAFARVFRMIAQQLIAVIESVHARGFVLGDISPNNVFIDPETLGVRLIDVESACRCGEAAAFAAFARAWHTPGFRHPKRYEKGEPLAPADDWYALGMLLHGLFLPLEGMIRLNPAALPCFLKRFVEAGLPRFIEVCITSLLEGDIETARHAVTA